MTIHKIKIENSPYELNHLDSFSAELVSRIATQKNAKYLGEFSVKDSRGNWLNTPVMIFYQQEKHPVGSNYFGVFLKNNLFSNELNQLMIVDGISATEHEWNAIVNTKTNEALYSAYRHDAQGLDKMFIDGGPEYLRGTLDEKFIDIKFKIDKDKLVLVDNNSVDSLPEN